MGYSIDSTPRISARGILVAGMFVLAACLLSCVLFAISPSCALADEVDIATGEVLEAPSGSKIHILSFASNNSIVLESQDNKGNKVFAMVDSGEDSYYPGSPAGGDPLAGSAYFSANSYTAGSKTTIGQGHEEEVLEYLEGLGATPENFKVYLGTHIHSDHIGSAPQVIMRYAPETVYLPLYSDGIISSSRLFDNQWIYDRAIAAADEVGATVLPRAEGSRFPSATPEQQEPHPFLTESEQTFQLGQMKCTIVNYRDIDLDTPGQFYDCNDYSWGLLVEVSGKRIFIAGDINDYNEETGEYSNGTETAIKDLLAQEGSLDLLVLGHHGYKGSNTAGYLMAVKPVISVQTNKIGALCQESASALLDLGSAYYATGDAAESGASSLIATIEKNKDIQLSMEQQSLLFEVTSSEAAAQAAQDASLIQQKLEDPSADIPELDGLSVEELSMRLAQAERRQLPGCICYRGGVPASYEGLIAVDSKKFYFENASAAISKMWKMVDGKWYYFDKNAAAASGWAKVDGKWYYFAPSTNIMQTGWIKLSGKWYYLNSKGAMQTGFKSIGGHYYYLAADGHMLKGWQKIGGYWRYFESSGKMGTGWEKVKGYRYYLGANGKMRTGWKKISGRYYYFGGNGKMRTGWKKISGYYRYFGGNGKLRTGWAKISRSYYYFDSHGRMVTGTKTIGGKTYRFASDGKLK